MDLGSRRSLGARVAELSSFEIEQIESWSAFLVG
jgi:hypothetical protein